MSYLQDNSPTLHVTEPIGAKIGLRRRGSGR
jgi:hypothetical protein